MASSPMYQIPHCGSESRRKMRMSSPFPLAPVTALQQSSALRRLSLGNNNRRSEPQPNMNFTQHHQSPQLVTQSPSCHVKKLARSLTCVSTPEKIIKMQRRYSVDSYGSVRKRQSSQQVEPKAEASSVRSVHVKYAQKSSLCDRFLSFIFRLLRNVFYCILYMFLLAVIIVGGIVVVGQYRNLEEGACRYAQYINVSEVQDNLEREVYGQHVAINVISENLKQFMSNQQLSAPLVLSFHGWTGVGKNHVSDILARSFSPGSVHKIILPLHYPHSDESERYSQELNRTIMNKVRPCSKQLFVIDDLDKASWDVVPALRTVLEEVNKKKLSHSSVVFVLLSSTGSTDINLYTLRWLSSGGDRHAMSHDILKEVLLAHDSWHSHFYNEGLITDLVPFLPLEKQHVQQCVVQDLKDKGKEVKDSLVEEVANDLTYFPRENPLFSTSGCRKVTSVVDIKIK